MVSAVRQLNQSYQTHHLLELSYREMDEFDRDISTADLSDRGIDDFHVLRYRLLPCVVCGFEAVTFASLFRLLEPTARPMLQNIKRLDLSKNKIGATGAEALASMLHKKVSSCV